MEKQDKVNIEVHVKLTQLIDFINMTLINNYMELL